MPLINVISFFGLYFFALGMFIKNILPEIKGVRFYSLSLLTGILVNYALVMIFHDLSTSIMAGTVLALVSTCLTLIRHRNDLASTFKVERLAILLMLPILLYFLPRILFIPVTAVDARLIWFFNAKIIFFGKTLAMPEVFTDYTINTFAHPDYPKLVPVMAAQFAFNAGFWNQYVPRFALFVLFVTLLFSFMTFIKNRPSFYLLFFAPFLMFKPYIGNGYMDGYLSLYAGITLLSLIYWITSDDRFYLFLGLLSTGVVLGLKNEGQLAILLIYSVTLLLSWLYKINLLKKIKEACLLPIIISSTMALAGNVLWQVYRLIWGINNDLQLGTDSSFSRIIPRITTESALTKIFYWQFIFGKVYIYLLIFLLLLIFAKLNKKVQTPRRLFFWAPLTTSLTYFSAMYFIYLVTPLDLGYHLVTSADRTMMMVLMFFVISIHFILAEFEKKKKSVGT